MRDLRALLLAAAVVSAACGTDPEGAAQTNLSSASSREPASTTDASTTVAQPSSTLGRAPVVAEAPTAALAAGFNEAGFDLLRTLAVDENAVLSPSSIGHALLMARAAADPETGAAIDAALGLPEGAHEAWNRIDRELAAATEVTLTIVDRIWPRLDAAPDPAWLDLLATHHGAGAERLDLAGDPEGSRNRINRWVAEQTEGLIPELLPPDFIDPMTVLVLTDTVYFKAQWGTVFGKYGPVQAPFTRLDGGVVDIEFMQELELGDRRGRGDGFVGAEIPYIDDRFSMLVIVPDEGRFGEIRDRLDHAFLDAVDAAFTTGPYELLLPKWHDNAQIDLLDWFTALGAAPGNYPAIAPDGFLDAAVHGADIEVDEWGTVAAAATAIGFAESGSGPPDLTVAADHPFLYLIRHRPTGLVLFAGQVTDPTS